VKGAFTGATNRRGQVESANGGVIFLDEIGLVDKSFQAKLLRLIEERQYRKVGEDGPPHNVDCRINAATSRNLAEETKNGNFLLDLYQRLDGVSIAVPPLRERREDIPILLAEYARTKKFSSEAKTVLFDYEWPGNTRELRNVAQKCSLVETDAVSIDDLPPKITGRYTGILEYSEHVKDLDYAKKTDAILDRDRDEIARQAIRERIGDDVWLKG
jgi:two-component system, NtrC family, response regulator